MIFVNFDIIPQYNRRWAVRAKVPIPTKMAAKGIAVSPIFSLKWVRREAEMAVIRVIIRRLSSLSLVLIFIYLSGLSVAECCFFILYFMSDVSVVTPCFSCPCRWLLDHR